MQKSNARLVLYSSLSIVLLVILFGARQIPTEGRLAAQALNESVEQESIVLDGAVRTAVQAMKYRLLDVLKAEGNDHATRTFQDSPFTAATLLQWDEVKWKSLWYSVKTPNELQSSDLSHWLEEWPLSKLSADEVYFVKVQDAMNQPHFAMLVPVRRPNQIPMVGVGFFPASQFGLNFSAGENREIRVFTEKGDALALSHPAYLGANIRDEGIVNEILSDGDVSLRRDWKTDRGLQMTGLVQKVGSSNLYAEIEAQKVVGSRLRSWIYLIFCALGAGLLNWALFSGMMKTALMQLSQAEDAIRHLGRQLSEQAAAAAVNAPLVSDSLAVAELPNLDFHESTPAADAGPAESEAESISEFHKIAGAALRALEAKTREAGVKVMSYGLNELNVEGDPLQLQTAIEEILKNAVEAMASGARRELTLSGRKELGGQRFTVADTGAGIPAADLNKIFDPFFSTKDSQGVARGLGLNVARRVIEELGGRLSVKSEVGQGTRVEIFWPLTAQAEAHETEVESKPASVEIPEVKKAAAQARTALDQLDMVIADEIKTFQHKPAIAAIRKPIVRPLD